MEFSRLIKIVQTKINPVKPNVIPQHIHQTVLKMDVTIDRLNQTTNLKLFKTDYLE